MPVNTEDISKWLERSGYALEMRVARAFYRHVRPEQGMPYKDPLEGKIREIDVMATWGSRDEEGSVCHLLRLVIECKTTEAPWIVFGERGQNVPKPLAWPLVDPSCAKCEALGSTLREIVLEQAACRGHGIVEKGLPRNTQTRSADGGGETPRGLAYGAVQTALSAAIGLQQEVSFAAGSYLSTYKHIAGWMLPVVVTTAPLFSAWLGDAKDGAIHVEKVESALLRQRHAASRDPSAVLVLTEPALSTIADACSRAIRSLKAV